MHYRVLSSYPDKIDKLIFTKSNIMGSELSKNRETASSFALSRLLLVGGTRLLFGLSCHNSKISAKMRKIIESTKSANLFGWKFVGSKIILYFCTQILHQEWRNAHQPAFGASLVEEPVQRTESLAAVVKGCE